MLCDQLKALKNAKNMTSQQLSDLSGIPVSTISRILSGQTDSPSFQTICDLVIAMGGSLDELAGIDSNQQSKSVSEALVDLYERDLSHERKMNRKLLIIIIALIATFIFIVLFDLTNGGIGYIRY